MITRLAIGLAIGAAIGGLMGYYGQCSSGACPLTANPVRGALYGGFMGLMLAFAMGKPMPAVPNSPHIISIATSGELDAFTGPGAPPVVLKFYSDTCPPCRQLAPILNKLAEEYASRVKTLAVNIGNTPEIAEPFAVRAVPTVLFLKGGKEVDRLVGLHPESDYRKAWDALLPPS